MGTVLAIDPGPVESAWVFYNAADHRPAFWKKAPNSEILNGLDEDLAADRLAIEMIASYGMAVGADVFETCVWIGRFIERWTGRARPEPLRIYRREVKLHLCQSPRAKDANVRQALIDRYGPGKDRAIGRKATPGPLYGMAGDCWAALGVAVTAVETHDAVREAA